MDQAQVCILARSSVWAAMTGQARGEVRVGEEGWGRISDMKKHANQCWKLKRVSVYNEGASQMEGIAAMDKCTHAGNRMHLLRLKHAVARTSPGAHQVICLLRSFMARDSSPLCSRKSYRSLSNSLSEQVPKGALLHLAMCRRCAWHACTRACVSCSALLMVQQQ